MNLKINTNMKIIQFPRKKNCEIKKLKNIFKIFIYLNYFIESISIFKLL